ncbi:50S ribosomal protein L32 [Candidatus Falkowbacteria bacterium RIFOXYC2_FULL_48_21]|uniref:Large ribosomal subunit protein bL32 n=1 Tax=Candidatus Falkowbacteria bacterium RIFOXYC2_FULL_48_21 TaxID=1798005 RepID=A0A1F5T6C7_9BACT|nr:MAG: 50S ribosomal protein L32 [Candidatus Falkowbacteria bacterium RIFOXYC2_FULL_48_21]
MAPIKPHRACGACGFYKGRQVLVTKADIKVKRTEKRKKQEQKEKERMAKLKNK